MARPAELVQAWVQAYNERDAGQMLALLSRGYHHERPGVSIDGAENFVAYNRNEWGNRPDAQIGLRRMMEAGNTVVMEATWSITATKQVVLQDGGTLAATGARAVLPYVGIWEVSGDFIVSDRNYWDTLSFFAQLGVPAPDSTAAALVDWARGLARAAP